MITVLIGITVTKISEEELPPRIRENDAVINFYTHCGTKVRNANAKFCVQCGKALVDN